jgi:hypothetical protein
MGIVHEGAAAVNGTVASDGGGRLSSLLPHILDMQAGKLATTD